MMAKTAEQLILNSVPIPSLPEIFVRLDDAINNPRCSIADIGDILSEDTALAARLLRIANSAFFNFPAKIDTITRAMTVVGTKQLKDLVLATSVMKMFEHIPDDLISMRAFWGHSIGTGVSARVIATYLREPNVEHFYVAGLLHDIGRLIIFTMLPAQATEILRTTRDTQQPITQQEKARLKFDHSGVGGALLKHWKLPSNLRETIAYHHRPHLASHYPREAAILHLADILAHALELGDSGEPLVPKVEQAAWDKLGLSYGVFRTLVPQIDHQYEDALRIFLDQSI